MNSPYDQKDKISALKALFDQILAKRPLIVASNRGPVEHRTNSKGLIEPRFGSGGIVTALRELTKIGSFTWVSSAMGEGDRKVSDNGRAGSFSSPLPGHTVSLRYVVNPRRVYHKFYNVFCNPLLWFLQHDMWNGPYNPNIDASAHEAWYEGFVPVNESFGKSIIDEAKQDARDPIVFIHDYQLYLVPTYVRAAIPNALIHYMNHIPWPTSRYWQLLPMYMRKAICQGLLSADIVGFQTPDDVRNFLNTCETYMPEAKINHSERTVNFQDRIILVRTYPVSINVTDIRRIANSPRALEHQTQLDMFSNQKLIVRVDRAEPSKNIVRGFRAFRNLLYQYPELQGKVTFLAFIVPSRTHVRQYQRYLNEIETIIGEINNSFKQDEWKPIIPFIENNYIQAIAGMKIYDVLLVNPMIDGMTLVAKEGPVINTKDGVVILSESTGAFHQLWESILPVGPTDIEGTMQAMFQALTMSAEERARRALTLTQTIEKDDIINWLYQQLDDLSRLL